jgi:hypothetical protein
MEARKYRIPASAGMTDRETFSPSDFPPYLSIPLSAFENRIAHRALRVE